VRNLAHRIDDGDECAVSPETIPDARIRELLTAICRVGYVLDQHRLAIAKHSHHLAELEAELEAELAAIDAEALK
jgi:hypothetical protein